jgi:hypothetical protein
MTIYKKLCKFFCIETDTKSNYNYIKRTSNQFCVVEIPNSAKKLTQELEYDKITLHLCDKDFKIFHATNDITNNISGEESIGKFVRDIYSKDLSEYLFNLHKLAQKERKSNFINLVINNRLVFLSVRPLIFYDDTILGSSGYIIPYKI